MNNKKVCVIGAGLAGGTIAYKLSKSGIDVTLLEAGTSSPKPYEGLNEKWNLDSHKSVFTRGSGIGGTSNFWHGGLTFLDRNDVNGVSNFNSSSKFPINYDELVSWYKEAVNFTTANHKYSFSNICSVPSSSDNEFEINANKFKYKGLMYPSTVFCTHELINEASKIYSLKTICSAEVLKLNVSANGDINEVVYKDAITGLTEILEADIFILCAGGLGSPKILLNSFKEHPKFSNLPIGKYLIDHPSGFVFKAKLKKRMNLGSLFGKKFGSSRIQYGFILNEDELDITGNRNHILFLRPALTMKDPLIYDSLKRKLIGYKGKRLGIKDLFYLIINSDLLYEAINFKFNLFNKTRYVSGLVFSEQLPSESQCMERVDDNSFEINWKITSDEGDSIHKFVQEFIDQHNSLIEDYIIYPNVADRLDTAGHHSGGCRMSSTEKYGVVDESMRVFNTDNVYVSDGSVLGYSGHANTGLTIIALALRLSKKITDKLADNE